MKIVKFDKSKAPTAITNALKGAHQIIDLSEREMCVRSGHRRTTEPRRDRQGVVSCSSLLP